MDDYRESFYDQLTELPNRRYLSKYYEENKNKKIALVFLDLDNFKLINDVYGLHSSG